MQEVGALPEEALGASLVVAQMLLSPSLGCLPLEAQLPMYWFLSLSPYINVYYL